MSFGSTVSPPKDIKTLMSQRLTTGNNVLHCFGLHPAEFSDWIPIKQVHNIQVPPCRSMPCENRGYHFYLLTT